jgi:hypothetical protein
MRLSGVIPLDETFVPQKLERWWLGFVVTLSILVCATRASAQAPDQLPHDHAAMQRSWMLMQDGVVFTTVNHQGGPRGGDELAVQNWWMGMGERTIGGGRLRIALMFSLEPATLGKDGYRELFQSGETLNDFPLIDRQHPHDFLMQASVSYRMPVGRGFSLTVTGAPVGEPALGPVAFMHRSSAFENPTAPLSHHTLDSTHITMNVLTAGVDRGPWQVEASAFHGAEPDENRWDLDPGTLDSWSVRGWYRPTNAWTFQVSHGYLTNPEASETGDIRRTTASASWLRKSGDHGSTAATIAYGRNNEVGGDFNAFIGEVTHTRDRAHPISLYSRFESLQVEDDLLRFGVHGFTGGGRKRHVPETGEGRDWLTALTIGGVQTLGRPWGLDLGAGADVTFYVVPQVLQPLYESSPTSFHVFFRLRPPSPMGRMVETTMGGLR